MYRKQYAAAHWGARLIAPMVLVVLALAAIAPTRAAPANAQSGCDFVLGFATLRDLVGPGIVGQCVENQRFAGNGNAEQRTTGGLMVWRKADNWTAFTDGYRTWLNGPQGLVRRLNTERYAWEGDAGTPGTVLIALPGTRREPAAPVLAWYYPQFNQGWATDAANAQRAGIDALVISQTTHSGSLANAPIVRAARGSRLLFTVGFETQQWPTQQQLIGELRRILEQDARDPQFLHFRGRPVVVFWALPRVPTAPGQSPQAAWRAIREAVDPGRSSLWIAEGGDTAALTGTMTYMAAFDALHLYSVSWDADPGRALAGWARRLRAGAPEALWVATVMPGGTWDDFSKQPVVRNHRDREAGGYLARAWQGAMATRPDLVIVTSYNEVAERTGIAPAPEWGNLYLDLNRQHGDAWRASVGASPYGS